MSGIDILAVGTNSEFVLKLRRLSSWQILRGSSLLIVVEVIVFVAAFCGCCGAIKENHCVIMKFAGLVLVVFGMELAGGITGCTGDILESTVNISVNKATTKTWDFMQ
jgi:CD63 antigen